MTDAISWGRMLVASLAVAMASALVVRLMRAIAIRKALLDVPNERSSHRVPVPRLGGAGFVPVVLVALGLMWTGMHLPYLITGATLLGALALYAISLADDFRPLPTSLRFGVQLLASIAAVGACVRHNPDLPAAIWLTPMAMVGVLNIYNFMDGIDGIAGCQAIAAGVTWAIIGGAMGSGAAVALGCCLAAAATGFLTLNWPPAKIFMGDAGSTVLGFFFAFVPLLAWTERHAASLPSLFVAAGLVLWPFLLDGSFTLMRRLRKGENIFKAHRSHLYQRLVIAGKPHRTVSLVYGGFAAFGGVLACWVVRGGPVAITMSLASVAILFAGLWRWTVGEEHRVARAAAVRPA